MNGQLARLARDTVETADRATLTIHGCTLAPDDRPVMGLHADNGWPVFWCTLGSAVAVAAEENRTAVLIVRGPEGTSGTVTVLLTGRLEMIGHSWDRGRQVGAVTLAPAQVLVETWAAGRPAVSSVVPVGDYADADPSGLAVQAAQITGHTNAVHGDLLRCFTAARVGVPAAQLAAAWLTSLDASGAQVEWVDAVGAHAMTVSFSRQARTATELAMLLRELLAAGCPEKRQ